MRYYVNIDKEQDEYHEVHAHGCTYGAKVDNSIFLGEYEKFGAAIKEARKYFAKSKECSHCSRSANKYRFKQSNLSMVSISKIINRNK